MPFAPYTTQTAEDVLAKEKSSRDGLSSAEAGERLKSHGPNALDESRVSWVKVLGRQFRSPFLYLLVLAAGVSFALGELIDAGMIAGFVLVNAGLGFFQEYQSERSVELLRTFVTAKSRVRRDGKESLVNSHDLVPGDIVVVETGDVIHADLRFVETENLVIDESVLTGESIQVAKDEKALATETSQPFEAHNIGFAGTTVASGRGVGMVVATGKATEIGDISRLTAQTDGPSAFEKSLGKFSVLILQIIVVTLVAVFVLNIAIKGLSTNIPELLIFSIALAVSVIPEALPIVVTTTLSRGALRLAHRKVVVKRLSAIEDLGSIDVLCTDKTGTLTENKMAVAEVSSKDVDNCLYLAAVGSSFLGEEKIAANNAFDIAVWNRLSEADRARATAEKRSEEVPFDPVRRWNSVVVGDRLVVRGAPEEIIALCKDKDSSAAAWEAEQGKEGRRVLAVATRTFKGTVPTAGQGGLELAGIVSFEDPVKESTKMAIAHAKSLGVAVKILTGDSLEVAESVARQVGLIASSSEAMTGGEWAALSEPERDEAAKSHAVFARVSPQQKYLIIESLRKTLEVGFLGEGINDAPALKIASVGIVVDGASDIAREAADIVLLDHSLEVIIGGIREGREVFANTVKYIKATLASNFGNFLAIVTATLLVDYLPMLSVQILLLNLLTDFPMIAIATDAVDNGELASPRTYDLKDIIYAATVLGIVSTMFDFLFFGIFRHMGPERLQTNWFIGSVLTELVLVYSVRTRGFCWKAVAPSSTLLWLTTVAAAVGIAIPFLPFGTSVFHFVPPTIGMVGLIIAIVAAYFIVTETAKFVYEYRVKALANSAKSR
ncbi:MAG: cation-transporting P-type ATPase [Candidatus Uhrbacteria bacterium]